MDRSQSGGELTLQTKNSQTLQSDSLDLWSDPFLIYAINLGHFIRTSSMARFTRYIAIPAIAGVVIGLILLFLLKLPGDNSERKSFAYAVNIATPAVVNIFSSKLIRRRIHPICEIPRFREFCNSVSGSAQSMENSLGSGVIVRSDGYILTNNHVIEEADEIIVAFSDGRTSAAEIVGTDPETDLAVIKVNDSNLTAITIGSSDKTRVGDLVLAIGNPYGFGQTVSLGIISAKGRYGVSDSPYENFLQTDAAVNPGNSGGALIDVEGKLVGINTLIYTQDGGYQGISFAIPSNLAMSVMTAMIEQGQVVRGWLGIEVQNSPGIGSPVGLVVTGVVAGGPAAQAGLQPRDEILAINDQPAISSRVVTRQIALTEPGSDIKLNLVRNKVQMELHAIAGVRPKPE